MHEKKLKQTFSKIKIIKKQNKIKKVICNLNLRRERIEYFRIQRLETFLQTKIKKSEELKISVRI